MRIAVVGSAYGQLDLIYEYVNSIQYERGYIIDLIVVCGNFQAIRNENDLKCMSTQYSNARDFEKYFFKKKYPQPLTLLVGGNCEVWNYFQTLPYGGWIAPNIYYMGYSNVVRVNGVRIGAISGLYRKESVNKGRFEMLPYNSNTIRSVYHTRYLEAFRMLQLDKELDVMITNDWPRNIYKKPDDEDTKTNVASLKTARSSFEKIETVGSPLHELVLKKVKPKHWFSGYMHLRFENDFVHESGDQTHFLALDRCASKRVWIEIVNVKSDEWNQDGLEYDLEWLAILKLTNGYVSTQEIPPDQVQPPKPQEKKTFPLEEVQNSIKRLFENNLKVPCNFEICQPYNLSHQEYRDVDPERKTNYTNNQTTEFCQKLGINDPMQLILDRIHCKVKNDDRIDIDDDEESPDWNETEVEIPVTATNSASGGGYNDDDLDYDNEDIQSARNENAPISRQNTPASSDPRINRRSTSVANHQLPNFIPLADGPSNFETNDSTNILPLRRPTAIETQSQPIASTSFATNNNHSTLKTPVTSTVTSISSTMTNSSKITSNEIPVPNQVPPAQPIVHSTPHETTEPITTSNSDEELTKKELIEQIINEQIAEYACDVPSSLQETSSSRSNDNDSPQPSTSRSELTASRLIGSNNEPTKCDKQKVNEKLSEDPTELSDKQTLPTNHIFNQSPSKSSPTKMQPRVKRPRDEPDSDEDDNQSNAKVPNTNQTEPVEKDTTSINQNSNQESINSQGIKTIDSNSLTHVSVELKENGLDLTSHTNEETIQPRIKRPRGEFDEEDEKILNEQVANNQSEPVGQESHTPIDTEPITTVDLNNSTQTQINSNPNGSNLISHTNDETIQPRIKRPRGEFDEEDEKILNEQVANNQSESVDQEPINQESNMTDQEERTLIELRTSLENNFMFFIDTSGD